MITFQRIAAQDIRSGKKLAIFGLVTGWEKSMVCFTGIFTMFSIVWLVHVYMYMSSSKLIKHSNIVITDVHTYHIYNRYKHDSFVVLGKKNVEVQLDPKKSKNWPDELVPPLFEEPRQWKKMSMTRKTSKNYLRAIKNACEFDWICVILFDWKK